MIFDMGVLGGQARYKDEKFLKVWCNFELSWLPRAWAWELAVVLATPGFGYDHHCWAFAWNRQMREEIVPELVEYWRGDVSVEKAAVENGRSIGFQDGIDYLEAMLETKRGYSGSVPLWTTLALQQLRDEGQGLTELARRFRTTPARVQRWWSEERFDPLTGLALPWR